MVENLEFDAMIREGNICFNQQKYEKAAIHYDKAGDFAVQRALSKENIAAAFTLAINSWVSACNIKNVFRILENKEFEGKSGFLNNIYPHIETMVNLQIKKNEMEKITGDLLLEKAKKFINEFIFI